MKRTRMRLGLILAVVIMLLPVGVQAQTGPVKMEWLSWSIFQGRRAPCHRPEP